VLSFRLSFFYIAIFFVIGSLMPFWPVWLEAQGINEAQIGILLAVPVLGKVIFSPLFASLGDRLGERKRLMLLFMTMALCVFALYAFFTTFIGFLFVALLFGICWAPLMSFGDNITLLAIRGTPLQYGRLRVWGSLSFIAMSFGLGWFLETNNAEVIYWIVLGSITLTILATFALPDVKVASSGRKSQPVRALLKDRGFQIFMATVAMVHGSHALYYAFATLHWRSLGYSNDLIGFLWAEAVAVEVLFFTFGGRITEKISASSLLFLAGVAAVMRWSILAFDPNMEILIGVQSLHALTFGAMHLGAMAFISRTVPVDLSTTAQSLYGASAFGAGTGVTMLFAGILYAKFSALSFLVMSLMAGLGSVLALVLRQYERKKLVLKDSLST